MEKDQDGVITEDAPDGTIARLSAGASCSGCFFYRLADCHIGDSLDNCCGFNRADGKDVIFIRKP